MKAKEIRTKFLEYFNQKGHALVESSPLTPKDDPTLLFTNAGMVQFKKLFLGQEKRDYIRAVTSQKCLRVGGKHNDLENVGRTARHHTFFEMLGNFSFGDYFKEDAIRYCWEFLTKELKLDRDKLYVTIYEDDDEAGKLWPKVTGIDKKRIFKLGAADNFWSMGDTGPCGPCSEVYYDQGPSMSCGPECGIGKCDCDRYMEIWNLVFMQYDQAEDGTRTDLPRPAIDTGMGLERVAAVCQGVQSNYETDLFTSIIDFAADLAGVKYKQNQEIDTALQVIADHSRAIAFLIPDQVLPSNEGRGYVLRRLIRRASRFGRLMGLKDPFLHITAGKVVADMKDAYPELEQSRPFMEKVVHEEEERFSQTLDKGLVMLEEEIAAAKKSGASIISGQVAFKLYDTFGFPIDIVNDVAEKQGLGVDEPAFNECMAEQKSRAKAAWKGSGEKDLGAIFKNLLGKDLSSRFTGYDSDEEKTRISALLDDSGNRVEELQNGQTGWLVAVETPFYGESGGQLGDIGTATAATGKANVIDTVKPSQKLTAHKIAMVEGKFLDRKDVALSIDRETRVATQRNHTATHLLHTALKNVLGKQVNQSGSLVGPDRLRFDFTHISPVTPEEIERVEEKVNQAVLQNIKLKIETVSIKEAQKRGATALFGEKYGDEVRVVEVPGVSMELCGGNHLKDTGQTGPFVILSESGIASGVRRIEAATGWNALKLLQSERHDLAQVGALVKARPGETLSKVQALKDQARKLSKELERTQAKLASGAGRDIMGEVEDVGGVKVLAVKVDAPNVKIMREQMDALRTKMDSGVIALAAAHENGKVSLIIAVTKDLTSRFKAGNLVKQAAAEVGGGGGGRPDMAQAGGTNPKGIPAALAKVKEIVAG